MKAFNLAFQIHQPYRLRPYRFFDIGSEHYYYDDYANEALTDWLARKCYLPACSMLLRKIVQHKGGLKIAIYVSGVSLDLFQNYAPQVIEALKRLAETGHVEFIGGTWSHSLASVQDPEIFRQDAMLHHEAIKETFGLTSQTFLNSELIYSDDIGKQLADMGYRATLTEGARHILGWRSPEMIYSNAVNPDLRLLMRHFRMSDDLTFRFSNPDWQGYPLTPEKFLSWAEAESPVNQALNLCIDMEVLGALHSVDTGIFTFMETFLGQVAKSNRLTSVTPAELISHYPPSSLISVPHPLSWAEEERDISTWTGNELQQEALDKVYKLTERVMQGQDPSIIRDWRLLQTSDHFHYMSTRYYARELKHRPNPYQTPHEAFVNYMNILADLEKRISPAIQDAGELREIDRLRQENRELKAELKRFRKNG
jgi:alpha-amylase